jgi:hypothetical protein
MNVLSKLSNPVRKTLLVFLTVAAITVWGIVFFRAFSQFEFIDKATRDTSLEQEVSYRGGGDDVRRSGSTPNIFSPMGPPSTNRGHTIDTNKNTNRPRTITQSSKNVLPRADTRLTLVGVIGKTALIHDGRRVRGAVRGDSVVGYRIGTVTSDFVIAQTGTRQDSVRLHSPINFEVK